METKTPKPTLNPALREFWRTPARNRVLYGGRSSSKSWDAAGFATFLASNYKLRILCARQLQNKIEESVYTLLKSQIERFGLKSKFRVLDNKIIGAETGSEFMFYGLWRHIDEIKSLEGIDILWIEEAHNLTQEQWEILEPTIRKEGSQIWIIFNPRLATDFAYKRFVLDPPPNTVVRKINYDENPFLSDTILAVIEALKEEDYEEFQHVYLGVPRDSDDGAVIKRAWIQSALDAHLNVDADWTGRKCVGYDVADDGDDKNANAGIDGSILCLLDEWKGGEDELRESAARTKQNAEKIEADVIGYDSIGVGAGTGSHLNSMGWRRHFKFNAGAKVEKPEKNYGDTKIKNKDFFANLKAQAWWLLADRFRNTHLAVTKGRKFRADEMISIDTGRVDSALLERLAVELSTPLRDYDNTGKVKVESKKDLAKREIKSPNLADAVVIAASRGMLARVSITDML
ncbi:PBSX family phage terminase large subunit [Castellaniella ginsengisoli]|uniref:PBSX family phage terminase large subunit n=1 Tax=Castellaniella ginsengisoli TaxID=546114 RepID=A0AB39CU95_9BURK